MALMFFLFAALFAFGQEPHRCAACHTDVVADFQTHQHAKQGKDCGICHGPSEKHLTSVGNVPPDRVAPPAEVSKLCGNCHLPIAKQYESSAHFRFYASGKKGKTANCTTCHGNHAARPVAALAANCQRCHTTLPAACAGTPTVASPRVACMGCHARHTLQTSK